MAMPAGVEPASSERQSEIISDIPRHQMRFLNLYVYIITQNFNIFKLFHFEIFWRHNCDSNADYLKGRAP